MIQKDASTAKQKVRRNYSTELDYIQKTITTKRLKVSWHKVQAYSGNTGNDLADRLAKKGKNQLNAFKVSITTPTITDEFGNPLGQDPHKWIKKRAQTESLLRWQEDTLKRHITTESFNQTNWTATRLAWKEEGQITGGINSFKGSHTRTFKMKVLYNRLPTATRKRLYNQHYPTTKCLYCRHEETTEHVLACIRTKVNLTTILTNLLAQLEPDLNYTQVSETFYQTDSRRQADLIRGLVPNTWTEQVANPHKAEKMAARLVNDIINLFRKLIWNQWCR